MASSRRRLIDGKRERECTLISNNNEMIIYHHLSHA
eukprot:COSAG05_NODE_708_length_7825_cov_14.966865_9_plen_36_part_00